jgi:glutaconyl-CoA/methylmalonyl-CoA decarboxylase subunit delta
MIIAADIAFSNLNSDHMIIVAVGYIVCFVCLAILWAVFINLPAILKINLKGLFKSKPDETLKVKPEKNGTLTGEEAAAITAAIYMFIEDLHDEENRVLTIEKISRRYSPWSSKIYSVSHGLNKRF